jgi:DNA-binding MarR family transcriptional regulator
MPVRSPETLDQRLSHRLGVAGRLLRTMADAELAPLGVAAPGLGVLLRLAEEDGLTQAELSRRQRVEAPTMCRMVDRLARDGLVERASDPLDRRATRVSLTAEGRAVVARSARVLEDIDQRTFGGLDADERRTLAELLGRVVERVSPGGDG